MTYQEKALYIKGPRRSGKGTIAGVLEALTGGTANMAGPAMDALSGNFGMEPLIGKVLIVVSDARISGHRAGELLERLLKLTGGDVHTIPRKYEKDWTGRLVILSNTWSRLHDAAAAWPSRLLPLELTESWLGREDPDLAARLTAELPGILNWALDGLDRLQANGRFTETGTMAALTDELERNASTEIEFVRECCETSPGLEVPLDVIYNRYRQWCLYEQHMTESRIRDKSWFSRELREAAPGVKTAKRDCHCETAWRATHRQPVPGGYRHRVLTGITLRKDE